jgi:hypothetical protein
VDATRREGVERGLWCSEWEAYQLDREGVDASISQASLRRGRCKWHETKTVLNFKDTRHMCFLSL